MRFEFATVFLLGWGVCIWWPWRGEWWIEEPNRRINRKIVDRTVKMMDRKSKIVDRTVKTMDRKPKVMDRTAKTPDRASI